MRSRIMASAVIMLTPRAGGNPNIYIIQAQKGDVTPRHFGPRQFDSSGSTDLGVEACGAILFAVPTSSLAKSIGKYRTSNSSTPSTKSRSRRSRPVKAAPPAPRVARGTPKAEHV